ncbi:MAG: hypothetical protein ACOC56_04330 [Atribacterota bacterium]
MIIEFSDGARFSGNNAKDIVRQLKEIDAESPETLEQYMQGANARYNLANITLDTDDCVEFIKSLVSNNVVCIIEEG